MKLFWHREFMRPKAKRNPCTNTSEWDDKLVGLLEENFFWNKHVLIFLLETLVTWWRYCYHVERLSIATTLSHDQGHRQKNCNIMVASTKLSSSKSNSSSWRIWKARIIYFLQLNKMCWFFRLYHEYCFFFNTDPSNSFYLMVFAFFVV